MDKSKDNKKKPLKLSSTGRMQIRKNLGPSGEKPKASGNKKTIQIVFRNKNNQQKHTQFDTWRNWIFICVFMKTLSETHSVENLSCQIGNYLNIGKVNEHFQSI